MAGHMYSILQPGTMNQDRGMVVKAPLLVQKSIPQKMYAEETGGIHKSLKHTNDCSSDYHGPHPIEPAEYRRVDIPSIPRHITEEMLRNYFHSIGHKLDKCKVNYITDVNGQYRVVYLFFSSMKEVDEVMRTRPHFIGEFRLQLRRYTMPGVEKRMTKRVLIEAPPFENLEEMLPVYMSHFGQVVKVEKFCSANSTADTTQANSLIVERRVVEFSEGDAVDKLMLCSPHLLMAKELRVTKLVEQAEPLDAVSELIQQNAHRMERKRIKARRSKIAKEHKDQTHPHNRVFSQPAAYGGQVEHPGVQNPLSSRAPTFFQDPRPPVALARIPPLSTTTQPLPLLNQRPSLLPPQQNIYPQRRYYE